MVPKNLLAQQGTKAQVNSKTKTPEPKNPEPFFHRKSINEVRQTQIPLTR